MAVLFVRGKSTGTAAEGTLGFTTEPTAGNWLVCYIGKSANETQPKVSDNKGEAGWEVSATKVAGAFNTWFAKKKAVGGEKEIKAVEGTIQSITYAEISGTTGVIDKITALGTTAKSKEGTSAAFTSTDAGAIFLLSATAAENGSLGLPEAWTGGPPTLKNNQTLASRAYMGYEVPGTLIEAKTFTAHHASERGVNFLGVTLKPITEEQSPSVEQEAATGVLVSSAILHAKVNPNGKSTKCKFEYGTTEAYGSSTAEKEVGAGAVPVAEEAELIELASNTTYHYRISATNSHGTTVGTDQTFKTESLLPEAEYAPILAIEEAEPVLSGGAKIRVDGSVSITSAKARRAIDDE